MGSEGSQVPVHVLTFAFGAVVCGFVYLVGPAAGHLVVCQVIHSFQVLFVIATG